MKKRCGHRFSTWKQNSWNPHTLNHPLWFTFSTATSTNHLRFLPFLPCFRDVPTWQLLCDRFTKDLETLWAHSVFPSTHTHTHKTWVCISDAATLKHVISALLSRTWPCTHSQPSQSYLAACPPTPSAVACNKPPELQIVSPAAEILPKPPPVALRTQIGICVAYT